MASSEEVLYAALAFIVFYLLFTCFVDVRRRWFSSAVVMDWPVLGMLPGLLRKRHRIHQLATDVIAEGGGTFLLKGPKFGNMDMLLTADPANVHYILTKNFHNFGKGPEFKKIFDVLGEGIFAAEGESWENQRKVGKLFMGTASFQQFVARTTWRKTENALFSVLEMAATTGMTLDLQGIFQRFAFDCTVMMILGHDPESLTVDLRDLPEVKAFHEIEEAAFLRHVIPETVRKLQKWLNFGTEKKMARGIETIHRFLEKCIALNEENFRRHPEDDDRHDLFACYLKAVAEKPEGMCVSRDVWRDATLNFLIAGKDSITTTLSWFFWLLAMNPEKEEKLRKEITGDWSFTGIDDLRKLVYLHAALCETLRLFPPVALNHKAPVQPDTLPTGHRVAANTRIVISFFSMARLESVWGPDCLEFKPERWISDRGTITPVPSFKFTAFNAGPRTCLGKEMAFIQLKITAAAVLSRFRFLVADGPPISPSASVILHMEHGVKVQVQQL